MHPRENNFWDFPRPGNRLFRPAPIGGFLDGPRTLEPGRRDLGANPRDLGGFSRNSEKIKRVLKKIEENIKDLEDFGRFPKDLEAAGVDFC